MTARTSRKPTTARPTENAVPPPDERVALTPAEAAYMLGVNPWTVRKWIREGRIHAIKLGRRTIRLSRADVERFLTEQEQAS